MYAAVDPERSSAVIHVSALGEDIHIDRMVVTRMIIYINKNELYIKVPGGSGVSWARGEQGHTFL